MNDHAHHLAEPAPERSAFSFNPGQVELATGLLQQQCHGLAVSCGWWTNMQSGQDLRSPGYRSGAPAMRNVAELIALVHSEASEALEGARKRCMDTHLTHRPMIEVELADVLIRVLDMAGGLGLDVPGAMAEKLAYNASRADHKPAHRRADGGKAF